MARPNHPDEWLRPWWDQGEYRDFIQSAEEAVGDPGVNLMGGDDLSRWIGTAKELYQSRGISQSSPFFRQTASLLSQVPPGLLTSLYFPDDVLGSEQLSTDFVRRWLQSVASLGTEGGVPVPVNPGQMGQFLTRAFDPASDSGIAQQMAIALQSGNVEEQYALVLNAVGVLSATAMNRPQANMLEWVLRDTWDSYNADLAAGRISPGMSYLAYLAQYAADAIVDLVPNFDLQRIAGAAVGQALGEVRNPEAPRDKNPSFTEKVGVQVWRDPSTGFLYFEKTGHYLGGGFKDYWEATNGVLGAPTTEEYEAYGRRIQVFENGVLEWQNGQVIVHSLDWLNELGLAQPQASAVAEQPQAQAQAQPQAAMPAAPSQAPSQSQARTGWTPPSASPVRTPGLQEANTQFPTGTGSVTPTSTAPQPPPGTPSLSAAPQAYPGVPERVVVSYQDPRTRTQRRREWTRGEYVENARAWYASTTAQGRALQAAGRPVPMPAIGFEPPRPPDGVSPVAWFLMLQDQYGIVLDPKNPYHAQLLREYQIPAWNGQMVG